MGSIGSSIPRSPRATLMPPVAGWPIAHAQADRTVREIDDVVGRDRLRQARPGDRKHVAPALGLRGGEDERLAVPQLQDPITFDVAEPELRTRQVAEKADVAPCALGGL